MTDFIIHVLLSRLEKNMLIKCSVPCVTNIFFSFHFIKQNVSENFYVFIDLAAYKIINKNTLMERKAVPYKRKIYALNRLRG